MRARSEPAARRGDSAGADGTAGHERDGRARGRSTGSRSSALPGSRADLASEPPPRRAVPSLCALVRRAAHEWPRPWEVEMSTRTKPVIAVDVGGTFTDVCLLDPDSGRLDVVKVPSTTDPIDGVLAGVDQAGAELSEIGLFSHGTTVATNALITRRLPRAAMVTTPRLSRRHRDRPRDARDDLWDAYKDNARPYIRRRDRLEVSERVDHGGRSSPNSMRTRYARSPGSWPSARSRRSPSASSTPTPTTPTSDGPARTPLRGAARRADLDLGERPPGALRARAFLDDRCQRRAQPARRRLR